MKISRRIFLATGTAMAAVAMGQLGRPKRSSAQTGAVNLYSSRHYDTDEALYEGFTEQTGLEVNLVEASADELIERIQSEGANSPADVLITVDAGRLWRATEAGILAPISSPVLEASVPENLRHPDGQWFGLSKRARIIAYNKDNVNPAELSTYEDLADPMWRDRILVRSSNNIYNQSLVGSMIAAHGVEETEEWVRGLVANFARPPEGNDTAQIRAAAAGVGDLAIVNHYYVARLMESDDPEDRAVAEQVGVFFPNQRGRGTHVNISGGGVVASAPNREGAIAFLEYLVTPEAQRVFADGNNEYPVVDAVPPSDVVASLGDFQEDDVSAAIFGENNPTALMVCDRAGWQ